jgi:hypothetical protein
MLTDWTVEESEFDSYQEKVIFLSYTASVPALGPTQPPIEWTIVKVKRPEHEDDHSSPSIADVKNGGTIPCTATASNPLHPQF